MTEKENRVRQRELELQIAESKAREAKSALEHGYAKAKAELDREYARLQQDLEEANLNVEREKAWLEHARAELARGYEA